MTTKVKNIRNRVPSRISLVWRIYFLCINILHDVSQVVCFSSNILTGHLIHQLQSERLNCAWLLGYGPKQKMILTLNWVPMDRSHLVGKKEGATKCCCLLKKNRGFEVGWESQSLLMTSYWWFRMLRYSSHLYFFWVEIVSLFGNLDKMLFSLVAH